MTNPFVAEMRIFPFNFPPTGWAFCNGRYLADLAEHRAILAAWNDLRRRRQEQFRVAEHARKGADAAGPGAGPVAARSRRRGRRGHGDVARSPEIPSHNHKVMAESQDPADTIIPSPSTAIARSSGGGLYQATNNVQMSGSTIAPVGGNQPHNNMMPYLALNFCIALQGVYPPRT